MSRFIGVLKRIGQRKDQWQDRCDDRYGGFHIVVSPLPWDWRLRWFRDEIDRSYWSVDIGPIQITTTLRFWKVDRSKLPGINGYSPDFVILDEIADFDNKKAEATFQFAQHYGLGNVTDWQKKMMAGWTRNEQGVWEKDG